MLKFAVGPWAETLYRQNAVTPTPSDSNENTFTDRSLHEDTHDSLDSFDGNGNQLPTLRARLFSPVPKRKRPPVTLAEAKMRSSMRASALQQQLRLNGIDHSYLGTLPNRRRCESATPSKKPHRHSVVFNGTITDTSALPSTILQQPPVDHPPPRIRPPSTSNTTLATSLQSLSLGESAGGGVSAVEEQPTATRRSWNAVSLTPQLGVERRHARGFNPMVECQQADRHSHSPSPYDSASLILNNALPAPIRSRTAVYSMSDDEGGSWQPVRAHSSIFNDANPASSSSSQLSNGSQHSASRQKNGNHPTAHPKSSRNSLLINGQNGAPHRYVYARSPPLSNGHSYTNGSNSSSSSTSGGHFNNNSPLLPASYVYPTHAYANNNSRPPVPVISSQHNGVNVRAAYLENGSSPLGSTINGTEFPSYHLSTGAQRRSANGINYDSSPTQKSAPVSLTDGPVLRNGIMPNSNGRLKALYGEFINSSAAKRADMAAQPQRPPSTSPASSVNSEDGYVIVQMQPDAQGRFGFNVTGGADCSHPVIISRIIAGSSADRCFPRLNEGDQVVKINGQDISSWSYSNVVAFIRSLRTYREMALTIKPNVYRYGELDETENQYSIPEAEYVSEAIPRSDKLAQSLRILKEALDSETIVKQFEQLYRKKPGMTMDDSLLPANVGKNRYRDIRPLDATRVYLKHAPSGDYINANHVIMEIPSTGIVNRYIATQGPLPQTAGDFWVMIWEQRSTTIVMLTTIMEKDRVKCHQYWPNRKESVEYGQLVITNLSERAEQYCFYREFSRGEERLVTQMQYTAWPDHGVPQSPNHFIDFVGEVRRARNGSLDPIIVHCSAGIGRTGVLILMEQAACLIESNEPVYPLDLVKTMRNQRAMLIQTVDQYTFVCRCILQAYDEGLIKPLAEYQKGR
ncbi:hypothetical protein M3Y99_00411700 [Aphelenchoides fujianensis]|nr:hypothetical protein M3Y99_00411700 [Aphelenchoides fujianensis]